MGPFGASRGLDTAPDLVKLQVVQAQTLQYHWDAQRMTRYFVMGENEWRVWR